MDVRPPRLDAFDRAALACAWPAIVCGAIVAYRAGVSPLAFAPNVAAAILGSAAFIAARRRAWSLGAAAACGGALLAVTLAFGGMDGVRRWLFLGPVTLHASSAVSPLLLAYAVRAPRRAGAFAALSLGAVVHAAQPDAGQAMAFAAAALALNATRSRSATSVVGALLAVASAVVARLRPDPLQPVDHVERIVALAANDGVFPLVGALLALTMLFVPFVLRRRAGGVVLVLGVYFAGVVAAPALGHFPVPVLGAGAGPVLGWFAAMIAGGLRDCTSCTSTVSTDGIPSQRDPVERHPDLQTGRRSDPRRGSEG